VSGYEIHMGETTALGAVARPFEGESADAGAATERVLGTYLHGLFENPDARDAFLDRVFADAGVDRPDGSAEREEPTPYDRAARLVTDHLDLGSVLPEAAAEHP
jgi:adenosylcobyric acid synthase